MFYTRTPPKGSIHLPLKGLDVCSLWRVGIPPGCCCVCGPLEKFRRLSHSLSAVVSMLLCLLACTSSRHRSEGMILVRRGKVKVCHSLLSMLLLRAREGSLSVCVCERRREPRDGRLVCITIALAPTVQVCLRSMSHGYTAEYIRGVSILLELTVRRALVRRQKKRLSCY